MSSRAWKLAALVIAFAVVPTAARAQAMHSVCRDGTKSTTAGRGACSGHNGVDEAATKAFLASGKTVMCTDGSLSAGGRGACSGHGGIGRTETAKAEKRELKAEKKELKEEMKDARQDAKAEKKADKKADKKAAKAAKKDAKAPA